MAETGMVEKVARASFRYWRENATRKGVHLDRPQTFDEMPPEEREFALGHARAAIEAMREPTEEMISADALQLELVLAVKAAWAACDMIVEGPTSVASVACTAVLDHLKARAVIDAALKEGD